MPFEKVVKGLLSRQQGLGRGFGIPARLQGLQHQICRLGQIVDMAIQRVVIGVQQFKAVLQPPVQAEKFREIVIVFNEMMPVQLVQKQAGVMAEFGTETRVFAV